MVEKQKASKYSKPFLSAVLFDFNQKVDIFLRHFMHSLIFFFFPFTSIVMVRRLGKKILLDTLCA